MFAKNLENKLQSLAPIKVGGRWFLKDSRVILLLFNFIGVDASSYFKKLKKLAQKTKTKFLYAGDFFSLYKRKSCFWDAYYCADLVSYPSLWEGFGNQFLEAVYFKKPIVLFEYPVFKKDIKKEGYFYISLGDKTYPEKELNLVPMKNIKKQ